MIVKVEMYGAICDGCGDRFEMMDGWTAMGAYEHVSDELSDSDWSMTEDEKTWCPDCHSRDWDESEEYLFAYQMDENGATTFLGKII